MLGTYSTAPYERAQHYETMGEGTGTRLRDSTHPYCAACLSISSASSAVRGTMLETWMYSRGL